MENDIQNFFLNLNTVHVIYYYILYRVLYLNHRIPAGNGNTTLYVTVEIKYCFVMTNWPETKRLTR